MVRGCPITDRACLAPVFFYLFTGDLGSADNLQPVEEGRPWDAVAMRAGWPGVATGSFSSDKLGMNAPWLLWHIC